MLRDAGNNPNAAFNDFYLKELFNQHPRAGSLPTAAQINAISFERSYAINRERFSNARGFSFVMVGSFDVDKVHALLTTYIGGLPSEATAPAGFVDTGMRPVVTTGIAHKEAGIGQIGAGIVRVPMACYVQALHALADEILQD